MSKEKKSEKTKARKIYDIVSTIIIAIIFIFLVAVVSLMLWQRKTGTDSNIFGYYLYNVLTDSMEPTIDTGDIIICKKIDNVNDLKVGDIITFTAPSGRLKGYNETHRIYEIQYNDDGSIKFIKTAGDNKYDGDTVKVDDWLLQPDNIKAKYIKTTTVVSLIRNLLTKWYGYVLLIVLPLIIVFILFVIGVVNDKVKYEKEKQLNNSKQEYIEGLSEDEKKKITAEYLNQIDNQEIKENKE